MRKIILITAALFWVGTSVAHDCENHGKQPTGTEKAAYIEKIKLYDTEASYHNMRNGKGTPGVGFKLKNTGDRTLNKVKVIAYFEDMAGVTIAEEAFWPVSVSRYSTSTKPLKPNYIWRQERGRFFSADAVPEEWKEGAVRFEISEIEFASE